VKETTRYACPLVLDSSPIVSPGMTTGGAPNSPPPGNISGCAFDSMGFKCTGPGPKRPPNGPGVLLVVTSGELELKDVVGIVKCRA